MKIIHKTLFLISVYSMGFLLGTSMLLLRMLGIVKVRNWNRFPAFCKNQDFFKNGLIVVANHPSLLDPLLVSALFFKHYFWHPFRLSPWNIPDEANYRNWFWKWASARIIWLDRSSPQKSREAFRKAKRVLGNGGILIIFPEGGRTEGGHTSPSSSNGFFYSRTRGNKIRPLKQGVGLLAKSTNAPVLLVWGQGAAEIMPNRPDRLYSWPVFRNGSGWNSVTIKIGRTLRFNGGQPAEEVTQTIASNLLQLADEE